jgi:ribosomal protein S18 acetylase RimI-like enzyme
MTTPSLAEMLRRDGTDLAASRILLADGQPAGFALVARRGWISRLAAMGIVEALRGQGAGNYLFAQLLREARERGDHGMVLEVIEQNTRAVRLYERHGFRKIRRLVGLSLTNPISICSARPQELDIRIVANAVTRHGLPDLPWQLAGESLATLTPPARAYQLDAACAMITDPTQKQISVRALLVEPPARRQGQARRLIQALLACHPDHNWQVPPIFPEEMVGPFEKLGFMRDPISQWQMKLAWA